MSRVVQVKQGTRQASLLALAASGLFATMAMIVRLLSRTVPGPEIALVRFATGIAVVLGALIFLHVDLRPRRWRWLVSRGIFGGAAALLYFVCIAKIGVGMATLLNSTGPVWSTMFAWLLLREHPGKHALVALGMTSNVLKLVPFHPRKHRLDLIGVLKTRE